MLIKKPNDIPSSEITSKSNYLNRRRFMTGALATGAALASGLYLRHRDDQITMPGSVEAWSAGNAEKLSGIVKSQYSTTEKPNSLKDITNYNNYYEFSTDKYEPAGLAKDFTTRPLRTVFLRRDSERSKIAQRLDSVLIVSALQCGTIVIVLGVLAVLVSC